MDESAQSSTSDVSLKDVIMDNTRETKEMTKAVLAMSSAIKAQYSVPLALGAMYLAWKALDSGKIHEWAFLFIFAICLAAFFGESFTRVIGSGVLPWGREAAKEVSKMSKIFLVIIAAMLLVLVL